MRKQLVRTLSVLFPGIVTSFAYNQLTNPQVRKLRKNELATLNRAKKEILKFGDFDIQLYSWEGGKKTILLIHGWEGQAGNFSDLVEELLRNDFTVYAFDAPSHGFSTKGKTSLFEFTELVGLLIRKFQVKNLISHSFGGVATTYALYNNPELEIDKYVLLTTPDKFRERIDDVASTVGVTDKVKNRLIRKLEMEIGKDVNDLNVSSFVKDINVRQSLIIHDKNDKVIPVKISRRVSENWQESEFTEVEGTGHFRILRSNEVIEIVNNYFI